MEATNEVRSIHRLDLCSLVCDMLKMVGMGRSRGSLALHLYGTALDDGSREPRAIRSQKMTDDLDDGKRHERHSDGISR